MLTDGGSGDSRGAVACLPACLWDSTESVETAATASQPIQRERATQETNQSGAGTVEK
jgi:hypothetical protein